MKTVYILTNESMPNIIKIGVTDDLSRRLRELDNTSTPLPFECFYALAVEDAQGIEKLLHEAFDDKRVRQNREFFNCTPEQAKSALKIAEKMGGRDVPPPADDRADGHRDLAVATQTASRMRGSVITSRMSEIRVPSTVRLLSTITMLPARNMSWLSSASTNSGATVGRPMTSDTRSSPDTNAGKVQPIVLMIGLSAIRTGYRNRRRCSETPLARATVT